MTEPCKTAPEPDIRDEKKPMAREDKIVLTVIGVVAMVIILGVLIAIRALMIGAGVAFEMMNDGVGLKAAFITSLVLSFAFIILFALVAGEGVVGELGIMLIGFFVMLLFFTFSIALVL